MTDQEILDLPMEENDSGANTIRGYFKALLTTLFEEEEGFSGKRPFGNSGWTRDLLKPLVVAKVIPGRIDDEGYVFDYDEDKFNSTIFRIIDAL